MNFSEYIPLATRTAKWFPTLAENISHSAIGIFTEGGEIASEIKRVVIYGRPMTDEMIAHIREEVGDVAWYVALGCDVIGRKSGFDVEARAQDLTNIVLALSIACGAASGSALCLRANAGATGELIGSFVEALDLTHDALNQLCRALNLDFDLVLEENIAKLRQRYPAAYSDAAAEARADKGGLPHTQS